MPRKRVEPVQALMALFLALPPGEAETVYKSLGAIIQNRTEQLPDEPAEPAVPRRRRRRKKADPPAPPETVG